MKKLPLIVIMEDNDKTDQDVVKTLRQHVDVDPGPKSISTEFDFIQWFKNIDKDEPIVFILDLRVRWTRLIPGFTEAPDDHSDPSQAGLRCLQLIDKKFENPQVVIFTNQTMENIIKKFGYAEGLIERTRATWLVKNEEEQAANLPVEVKRRVRNLAGRK